MTRLSLSLVLVAAVPAAAAADFARDGRPYLEKYCLGCHGAKRPKADLNLSVFADEPSVVRSRKTWDSVQRVVRAGEMPPKNKPQPAQAETDAFLKAVADVFDRADRNAKPDPGRVTVRRLNRVEYDNTLRDLLGIDFSPSEDFPSDDIGHGFDNIGDVLSISPVLMERYLAAAEAVADRVIVLNVPKPSQRWMGGRYLEPAGPNVPKDKFRPLEKGNLNTPYDLSMDGEYTFRFRAYTETDAEPVKVSITDNGKEVGTLEIKAEKPLNWPLKLTLPTGRHRIAVNLLNPGQAGGKPRRLMVEHFVLEGPADMRPPAMRRLLAPGEGKIGADRTRAVLTSFVTRAYRRPPTAAELDRLTKLAAAGEAEAGKWEAGIKLAVQAVLVSPKFLFRLELDHRPQEAEAHPIDEYQLASRLSYFLWSTMPDQELFDLAARRQLTANLDKQVRRMLADPRAEALVQNFAMQWLQLRRLRSFAADEKLFPAFNDKLRAAMQTETELFLGAIIREDRSVLTMLDADFTFLNERLARHYGIADTAGNPAGAKPAVKGGKPIRGEGFQRVSLYDGRRGGLLTQGSVLAVTSNPTRTSPVKRGKWVLEQLLGTPPPPPPPNVPELEDDKAMLTGTLRQRMEQHRANPSCAGCHAKMDPLGFAFENYDAVGAYRTKDGGAPIDPSGELPGGRRFQGPAELKKILLDQKELFVRCLAEKMLIYAVGRGLEHYDKRAVDRIVAATAAGDHRFGVLVAEIVRSDPFRLRRGRNTAD